VLDSSAVQPVRVRHLLCLIALTACGGNVGSAVDGGSSSDGSGGDTSTVDTAVDCNALQAAYEYQLQQATVCCPVCNTVQCNNVQKGTCCPISTTASSIPAYTAALEAYLLNCPVACPAIPCRAEPSGDCLSPDPSNPDAMGSCQ
jgi:hypothetical protein